MKKKALIRMTTKSNPEISEYSYTNNVDQRIKRLIANHKATNLGDGPKSLAFERFAKFSGHTVDDLFFDVTIMRDVPVKDVTRAIM